MTAHESRRMNEERFSLRPFAETDFDSFAEIQGMVRPDVPMSSESLRHFDRTYPVDRKQKRFVVELRGTGRVVAIGGFEEATHTARLGRYWTFAFVRPEFQAQGIGTRLYTEVLEQLAGLNAISVRAVASDGETAGLAFLTGRGFVERRRSWHSTLDLRTADVSRLPSLVGGLRAVGIEITTAAQESVEDPRVVQELYRLETETSWDVPRLDPYVPWTLEEFRKTDLEGPYMLADAWFIAKMGERYIAMSNGERESADPTTLQQAYTGTLREFRRRGLALVLKLCVIDYGRRHHYQKILTNNDSLNSPMWALNERLGFRRESTWIQMEKMFADPG